ncbi:hypothetical protein WJ96_05480 [Burkholderia ubonensis]|uniref:Uncharacterized protein n=1 Tax=Burkholderia ubonensis TaxID=101571 RepID=A0AAW3MYX2_9BURK|nr:hypothetical protein WJ93_07275 [Burkholderia ubonensis]KVP96679.1 hypothetical protein WJ97_12410 [Burkholderia ubonensis]KVP98022.1 hypothetical protein WJ96_05480 [Burkholderia ubonensis]KVZ92719.1 hypothetical protein WL25_17140 [Burkholderia ubonensis]
MAMQSLKRIFELAGPYIRSRSERDRGFADVDDRAIAEIYDLLAAAECYVPPGELKDKIRQVLPF